MRTFLGLPAVVVLVTACGAGEGPPSTILETDSAGVRIVMNQSIDVARWQLDTLPTVQMGSQEAEGPEQFFRVSSARVLRTGEIAVFDGSREVRVFDRSGVFVRSFGGEGEGPGEYLGPGRMFRLRADTLAIWDSRQRRLTILNGTGEVLSTVSPAGIGRRPQILTVLPDRSTLFEQEIRLPSTPTEYTQQFSNYLLYGPDGVLRDSLPVQPRVEIAKWPVGPLAGPRLFEEGTQFAGDWEGYWIGITRDEEIRRYSLAGDLSLIVRWPSTDRMVEGDAQERSVAELLETLGAGVDREQAARVHRSREVPEQYPSHGPMLVDALDLLWVQEFERPGSRGLSWWKVFDVEGALRATVAVPDNHRVLDVGDDYVLAVGSDALGVEYVRMFRLTRS